MIRRTVIIAIILLSPFCDEVASHYDSHEIELLVCGGDEVLAFLLRIKKDNPARQVWRWCASDRTDLPESFKPLFNKIDECKPADDGRGILITSSSGGVAYVNRQDGAVLFYGQVAQAHSADLVPGQRIAVAASHDTKGLGDKLVVFDINKSDQVLLDVELPGGHGVLWDARRKCLWALSKNDIRAYELQDWDTDCPRLIESHSYLLPADGGHDLIPIPDSPYLIVTTDARCWLFNRDTSSFSLYPILGNTPRVKSVSLHPLHQQIAYVQASEQYWWSEQIRLMNPIQQIHLPGKRIYKARWNQRLVGRLPQEKCSTKHSCVSHSE